MPEEYQPQEGKWWRFDRYEIRDGLIQHASLNLTSYNPWQQYQESRQRGGANIEPPYQSLVRLATTATLDTRGCLTAESEAAVLSWCAAHGLLGIIPQFCTTLPGHSGLDDDRPDANVWRAGQWTRAVAGDHIPRYGKRFARFFPQISHPEDGVPAPIYPVFWFEYAEPVEEFLREANSLRVAIESLLAITPARVLATSTQLAGVLDVLDGEDSYWDEEEFGPLPVRWDEEKDTLVSAMNEGLLRKAASAVEAEEALNSLTSTVSPVLTVGPGLEYRIVWRCRSLLASFAMMILQDLTEGRRIRQCDNCGTLFLSHREEAAYCSIKCRNTAQKRRQRVRQKTKKKGEA